MVIVFIILCYYCYSIGITVTPKSPDESGTMLCHTCYRGKSHWELYILKSGEMEGDSHEYFEQGWLNHD